MEGNKLLELRQSNASKVYGNGDWNTTLSKNVEILEGDSVVINKIFIDTQAQTDQKVIIEKEVGEISINMTAYLYNSNITTTDKNYAEATHKNDGMDYVLVKGTPSGSIPADYHTITKIRVDWDNNGDEKGRKWGGGEVSLGYINLEGVGTSYSFTVPSVKIYVRQPSSFQTDIDVNFTAKDGSVYMYDPKKWGHIHTTLPSDWKQGETTPTSETFTPVGFPLTFTLGAGAYLPTDITRIINNKMTTNGGVDQQSTHSYELINNPFFKLSNDPDIFGASYYWCSVDGERYFKYTNATHNWFVGASQMELDWDNDGNKFYWKFLHTPIFDTGGSIISSINQDAENNAFFHAGKMGGIVFSNLSAEVSDTTSKFYPQPYDFWEGKLGFDLTKIIPTYKNKYPAINMGGGQFHSVYWSYWADGVFSTTARPDLDGLIDKTHGAYFPDDPTTLKSSNDLTTEIYAFNSVLNTLVLDYGYYYVEIKAGYENEIVGSDTIGGLTQFIQGIVNRYYSLGAYTSGGTESSLIYTHKGSPIYLRDIKVRILDSDKNQVNNIGEDNTIFLQIIRGNPPIQQQETKTKN